MAIRCCHEGRGVVLHVARPSQEPSEPKAKQAAAWWGGAAVLEGEGDPPFPCPAGTVSSQCSQELFLSGNEGP